MKKTKNTRNWWNIAALITLILLATSLYLLREARGYSPDPGYVGVFILVAVVYVIFLLHCNLYYLQRLCEK